MCGIFAVFSKEYSKNPLKEVIKGMKLLQHRGKDGYGIVYMHESKKIINFKESGELTNHTNSKILNKKSYSCVGHLRYSTSGSFS